MTKLKPNDYKAIGWYAEKNKLKLALSNPPFIFFKTAGGDVVERSLTSITAQWLRWRKEEKKHGN